MNVLSKIKNLLIYKGNTENKRFELLEDEKIELESHGPDYINEKKNEYLLPKVPRKTVLKPLRGQKEDAKDSLCTNIDENISRVKEEFNYPQNRDIVIREFKIKKTVKAAALYVDGMVDKQLINNYIMRQLMPLCGDDENRDGYTAQYLADNLLAVNEIECETSLRNVVREILNGFTAILIDGSCECVLIETRGYERRGVESPQTETVIRGSHEAFSENLRTNITLVRRIIRNKDLVTEIVKVGNVNHTNCAIMYIKGIANPKVVQEVKDRLDKIDMDFVSGDGEVCQFIDDHPYSLFPQIISTERPDRTASFLSEGQVVVITDGTPYASAVPVTLFHLLHTAEDTSLRWQYGTFLRLIRLLGAFFAVFLPGLYLALVLYHREMIPTELLFSIAIARENIPFPTVIELLLMEVSFELIREASLRIPGAIGQTLGIIGAVVLGEASVSAGIVSPILIIIVALSGMSSFAIPNFSLSFGIRLLRFVFIFFGSIAGLYGIAAGIFIVGGILCSMKSFGVPFLSPIAPKTANARDVFVRAPIRQDNIRPDYLNTLKRSKTSKKSSGGEAR